MPKTSNSFFIGILSGNEGKLLEALTFQKSEVWLSNSAITESRTNKSGLKIEVYLLGY